MVVKLIEVESNYMIDVWMWINDDGKFVDGGN